MIKYSNVSITDNIEFDKYLKFQGYSHSFLKGERFGIAKEVPLTEKIRLGKIVDGILTDPASIDMLDTLYPIAKDVAHTIKQTFGDLIKNFKPQISFTAEIEHEGFVMVTKGRLDYYLPNIAVIDLKVTYAKDVKALIEFMRYDNQLWHYCKAMGVDKGYLMIYSVPLKKTQLIKIDVSNSYNEFWAEKTLMFGIVK